MILHEDYRLLLYFWMDGVVRTLEARRFKEMLRRHGRAPLPGGEYPRPA